MQKTKMLRKLFKIEEKWVVFYDLFSKKRNGDSILPIAKKLRKERPDFKFFFCKKRGDNIEKIYLADEVITEKSLYFKYVLAKAKYVVSPMNFPKTKKRDGQKFIQTWHGTPLKKLYLSRDGKSKHNKRYAARISQNTDIFSFHAILQKTPSKTLSDWKTASSFAPDSRATTFFRQNSILGPYPKE